MLVAFLTSHIVKLQSLG